MLDAGALTPTEFEALKQRLVFSAGSASSAPPAGGPTPAATPAPAPPQSEMPPPPPLAPAPAVPAPPAAPPVIIQLRSPSSQGAADAVPALIPPAPIPPATIPPAPIPPAPGRAGEAVNPPPLPVAPALPPAAPSAPRAAPLPPPAAPVSPPPPRISPPVAFSTPPAPEPLPVSNWVNGEFPVAEAPPARNPLALILSIGGLLSLLGLVLYLSLSRRPSEHISSTSQTAADSVATTIETGPQAATQLPAPAVAPETVRVVPASPAPRVQRRTATPRPVVRDTAAATPPAPDSATGNY